ncbi:hypothetical protein HPP92_026569 [Vanilla planifolia]|uniref:Uncharacterized protein n=1 Tax=Vanilla planifolia TaxID=51239 RepID=A0A835PFZ7_VANPL|nr:hypothetical protein HPP92_026569 [Vanilla planifolia]
MEELDSIQPLLNSVSDGTCCESSLLSLPKKEPSAEVEQCTCTNFNGSVKNQDQWTVNCCSAVNEENSIDKEAGVVVDEVFYLLNSFGFFPEVDVISKVDRVVTFEEISLHQGLGYAISSDAKVQRCLSKSASFPSSDLDVSHTTSSSKIRSTTSTTTTVCNACTDQYPVIKRSISLPTNSKLISAMKGGRAQHGNPLSIGMRVKWAADVYDPPATSVSHTVNSGSYQRSNSRKKRRIRSTRKGQEIPSEQKRDEALY